MIKIKDLLITERYFNAIGSDADSLELKKKYAKQVWDILQDSYKDIGGIQGNGFASIDDMIKKIPFWKMLVKGGKIKFVIMYKDKGGRKSVAMGSDGSDEAKAAIRKDFKHEIVRSYGEKSKAALGALMKSIPWEILQDYALTPTKIKGISGDDVTPLKDVPKSEWPEDAVESLKRFPELLDYGYLREFGGEMHFKVCFGTPGNKVK